MSDDTAVGTATRSGANSAARNDDPTWVPILRVAGVQLGLIAIALHLYWGLPRAVVYLRAGTFADPRPYLFVVSGVALAVALLALYAVPERVSARAVYAFAVAVLAVWIAGYVWWHLGGHGGAIPGVKGYGHPDLANLDILLSDQHLFKPFDLATNATGAGALVAFGTLLGWELRSD
ncbi:hypothetical protein [Halobaculum marinum]|uniref:Uncharacterized protein n=1 Tax=Halobaculum marinum TaxID=3031996 RepID=A0ABD5WRH5_9EURY|nr:hypothetical protein [Halobaculum sp. DT55]